MTLLLAGDIGGTKTILRLVEASSSTETMHTLYEERYPSCYFPDLLPMVQKFLAIAKTATPQKAGFAIAVPVVNNTAKLTNLTWFLDVNVLYKE